MPLTSATDILKRSSISQYAGSMLRSLTLRTFIINLSVMTLGLAHSVMLSRWLGPTGRGEVAAAMLWPVFMVSFGSIGIISSTLYFAALPQSKTDSIFANGLLLAAVQSLFLLPIGFVVLPWMLSHQDGSVVRAAIIYLFVIPFSLMTQYATSILQGRMHIMRFNVLRLFIPVGFLLGILMLKGMAELSILNVVILHLALNIGIFFITLIVLSKLDIKLGLRPDPSLIKEMLKYGVKVQVGDISQGLNLRFDQGLMAMWLPPAQLGLYVVAVSAANLAQVISSAVRIVVTPSIARKASSADRSSTLQLVFRRYWLLSILATLVFATIFPFAIPLIFGEAFRDSILPSEVLLLATFFIGAKEVLTGGAQAMGSPWLGSQADLIALVVTLTLLFTLLPSMGIMGAAIATLTAYATELVVVVYGLYRAHGIIPISLFRFSSKDVRGLASP